MSSGYQIDWWKAIGAGLVLSFLIWAAGRLFPGRRAAPFIGAAVGVAALIAVSYLSWRLNGR